MVPTYPGHDCPVRLIRLLLCELRRQLSRGGRKGSARMMRPEEVVLIAIVVVDSDVPQVRVVEDARADGHGNDIVVQCAAEGRLRQELEPLRGERALKARVGLADHVRTIAVAAHELVSQERRACRAGSRAGIEVGIRARCGRVVDGDHLSVAADPVAEIAVAFLDGGNAEDGSAGAAADAEACEIKKYNFPFAVQAPGSLTGPPMVPPKSFSMSLGRCGMPNW